MTTATNNTTSNTSANTNTSIEMEISHFYGTEYDGFNYVSAPITEVFETLLKKASKECYRPKIGDLLLEEETWEGKISGASYQDRTRFWKGDNNNILVEWMDVQDDQERVIQFRILSKEDLALVMQVAKVMEELGVTKLNFRTLAEMQEFNSCKDYVPWASGRGTVMGFGPSVERVGIKTDKLYILSEDVKFRTALTGQYDTHDVMLYVLLESTLPEILAALVDFKKEHCSL